MTLSTISVQDMHCGNCVGKIERALAGIDGINGTYFNPARRLVLVEHSGDTDPAGLLRRIEDAGFHASLSRIETGGTAQRDLLKRLGIAGLAMMQVMMFAIALYGGAFDGMAETDRLLLQFASLAFCLPVVAYSAAPFFRGALKALRQGLNMDVPIALAISSAFLVSLANTISGSGEVYYDSVVMFTFLLLTARFVDDRLKARFEDANWSLADLPERALVVGSDGMAPVGLAAIDPGTAVWVEQGNQVPLDGTITQGEATLDESTLTGESVWVHRQRGESVFAGTMNRGPGFEIVTTAGLDATRIASIAELASRAQAEKPAVARLADRIARRFVPGVLLLAAVTWLGWQLVDPSQAFVAALTVLVVSCPCALSLATPAAITAAMTRLRQQGIVLTRSDALEQMADIDAAIVDKTGTLTVHEPVLDNVTWLTDPGMPMEDLLAATGMLERHANHPLARALSQAYPDSRGIRLEQVRVIAGAGVEGWYDGRRIRVGQAEFCRAPASQEHAVFLALDDRPVARFTVTDPLRSDAAAAVDGLKHCGIAVTMVSGDAHDRCAALAAQLDIGFAARQAPETKLKITRALQAEGHRVLVLGDGINDVPALAAADVSATVLESSHLVRSKADVLLLSRRLGALVELVGISRRTRRIVRQNLAWALAYNLTAMPLAALGFMAPWVAALGMAGSSILVMSNAARLLSSSETAHEQAAAQASKLTPEALQGV